MLDNAVYVELRTKSSAAVSPPDRRRVAFQQDAVVAQIGDARHSPSRSIRQAANGRQTGLSWVADITRQGAMSRWGSSQAKLNR
jgi:hypothetical protein